MRTWLPTTLSFVVGCALTWLLFSLIYQPSNNDFLSSTAASYFKGATENRAAHIVKYTDCEVQEASQSEKGADWYRIGLCGSQDGAVSFFVGLSKTGEAVSANWEWVN